MTRGANLHSAQNARRVSNAGEPGVIGRKPSFKKFVGVSEIPGIDAIRNPAGMGKAKHTFVSQNFRHMYCALLRSLIEVYWRARNFVALTRYHNMVLYLA